MAILRVVRYPHPILRAVCKPVPTVDENIKRLIVDMRETMNSHTGCVGISAPQVGVPLRIFVIDVSRKLGQKRNHGYVALVNPEITYSEGEKIAREGCLSIPELLGDVKRARRVIVNGVNVEGEEVEIPAKGLEAIAVQHEIDHLDGVLFIDRVVMLGRELIRRKGN